MNNPPANRSTVKMVMNPDHRQEAAAAPPPSPPLHRPPSGVGETQRALRKLKVKRSPLAAAAVAVSSPYQWQSLLRAGRGTKSPERAPATDVAEGARLALDAPSP